MLLVTGVDTGNVGGTLFTDDDDEGDGVVGGPDVDGPGLVPNTSNRARRFLRICLNTRTLDKHTLNKMITVLTNNSHMRNS